MKFRVSLSLLLAVALLLAGCKQAPTEPEPAAEVTKPEEPAPAEPEAKEEPAPSEITATGVFLGRSGKPMADARLILGEVMGDEDVTYARVRLVAKVAAAVADAQGRFQFKGFTPGTYTVVYQPSGAGGVLPVQINIRPFLATTKSITPLLYNVELGTNEPYAERTWAGRFTLLKGHTFYSQGPSMKIWNATVRQGARGPYLEIRRGVVWMGRFDHGSEINYEAWSF